MERLRFELLLPGLAARISALCLAIRGRVAVIVAQVDRGDFDAQAPGGAAGDMCSAGLLMMVINWSQERGGPV